MSNFNQISLSAPPEKVEKAKQLLAEANQDNPSESQILLQAKEKLEPDWVSINRLLDENLDFEEFITSLKIYYESGEINKREWYK